jgi:hypothetical protein
MIMAPYSWNHTRIISTHIIQYWRKNVRPRYGNNWEKMERDTIFLVAKRSAVADGGHGV